MTVFVILILSSIGLNYSACEWDPPSIGDFVWEDLDRDGIQDIGEPGIEGVTVELHRYDGKVWSTMETDENGYYEFINLNNDAAYNSYYVKFILPSGYSFTLQDQGTDDSVDSDANPTTGETAWTQVVWEEHDYTWDAGLVKAEECKPCSGKVTKLTLKYNGDSTAQIKVTQGKDKIPFNDEVDPNEEFTFTGLDNDGTLGKEVKIYVDDVENTKIHTSCSRPIGPGMVFGDFTVIEAYSRYGGLICPYEPCEELPCDNCKCWGKVTQLTLQYNGGSTAQIKIIQGKDKVVYNEEVDPNEQFTIYGVDKDGTLGTEIKIYVDDVENTKIHTSCSRPIGPDMVFGDFTIIEGYSRYGGLLCPYDPYGENPCWGKVTQLTLQYNGGSTAQIKIIQGRDKVVYNEEVDPNEQFTIYGVDKDGTLGTEIKIYVDDVLHTKIHTSCSRPIYPGLVSGDFTVIEGYSRYGGKLPAL
ncbi:DUF7467 domain-containing protein [[Eubacterium] cellulosolvens]